MKDMFPERFKECRDLSDKSQADIALVCEGKVPGKSASRAAVAQWEKGVDKKGKKSRPTFNNLVKAAIEMDASIDYMVGISNTNPLDKTHKKERRKQRSADGPAAELAVLISTIPDDIRTPIQEILVQIARIAAAAHDTDEQIDWSKLTQNEEAGILATPEQQTFEIGAKHDQDIARKTDAGNRITDQVENKGAAKQKRSAQNKED